jgi:hypothetical protein
MEYDSPIFIAAVKKVIRNLAGKADENKSAISEQTHAQIEKELPPPVTHQFNIPDSTIDRIKSRTAHEIRREWWKDFLEVAGIGVIIVYTIFAGFQWYELNTQNINQSAANDNSGTTADRTLMKMQQTLNETHNLAEAAKKQAIETGRIAEITRDSLTSVQRAFLSFQNFDDLRVQDSGHANAHYWTKDAVFQNTGATSAIDVGGVAFLADLLTEPTEDQFKGHYTKLPTITVPPKSSKDVPVVPEHVPEPLLFGVDLGEPVTPEMTTKTTFNGQLFVWGWAYYRDVFPRTKPHVTEFCSKIIRADFRPDLPGGSHIKFVYSGCSKHNCDDEQCKDYHEIVRTAEKMAATD